MKKLSSENSSGKNRTTAVNLEGRFDAGKEVLDYFDESSAKELEAAAVAAVEKWKFRPAMKNGNPIEIHQQAPIIFSLGEN